MKKLLFLVPLILFAQGTIDLNIASVTATAGSGITSVICKVAPIIPTSGVVTQATMICTVGGTQIFTVSVTPPPGNTNGVSFSAIANSNNVTVTLTSISTGLNWQTAANGVSKTGSF